MFLFQPIRSQDLTVTPKIQKLQKWFLKNKSRYTKTTAPFDLREETIGGKWHHRYNKRKTQVRYQVQIKSCDNIQ